MEEVAIRISWAVGMLRLVLLGLRKVRLACVMRRHETYVLKIVIVLGS
jgi:hypothetical protein